jgi:hypothetical protein
MKIATNVSDAGPLPVAAIVGTKANVSGAFAISPANPPTFS